MYPVHYVGSPCFPLIAAHLATMNREGVDKRLFSHMVQGNTGGAAVGQKASKRKRGVNAADRQQEAAATASLEGPGSFNLERLLMIFRMLTKQAYERDGTDSAELENELLSADVFMQISSMVRAHTHPHFGLT
jgi:origin recognition complex subunit 5